MENLRSKSAFEQIRIQNNSLYHINNPMGSEDKSDQTPKSITIKYDDAQRGDRNIHIQNSSKSDKIGISPGGTDYHQRMHGVSTGLGVHEQKSTEFMQVMSSVL